MRNDYFIIFLLLNTKHILRNKYIFVAYMYMQSCKYQFNQLISYIFK